MKRIWLLCLVCLLLFGCAQGENITTERPVATEAPVPEDAFFFANALEYYRLYCQTPDGGEPRLILDEECGSVCRRGNTVYFIQAMDLYRMDIATGRKELVQPQISDYSLAGDCLLYCYYEEDYRMTLCWQNLATGQSGTACTEDYVWFAAGENYGYYLLYNNTYDATRVYSLDITTGQSKLIREDNLFGYRLTPMEKGVLYGCREGDGEVWYFLSPDGTVTQRMAGVEDSEPFYASEEKILYVKNIYEMPNVCQIRQLTAQGEDTLLYEAKPDGYYNIYPLGDGAFLLEHYLYVEWGPIGEYGYPENYAVQVEYSYLGSDGTITPVNAAGASGSLFAHGDFPIIDSSTARKPVTAELYNLFVKSWDYQGAEPMCSTTHGAWLNIANGGVELALLAAPTQEEKDYLAQKGVEVEMKLYGGDGLVFIGNLQNPVADLTHEQLLDIYRGKITNWKELGGPDEPITVYYRDDQSGSQRLFEKLVWKDTDIPDFQALNFWIMDDMSSIVDTVQADPYSIGYTIMTYLDDVYGESSLRVFSINGVSPSVETVADASYAYHTQGYVVIRADEPADSPARRLYDWFGSAISDDLLRRCGVSPLHG